MGMKFISRLRTDDKAVSPVIGVILLVAITVILAAVIGIFVLGQSDQLNDPGTYHLDTDRTPDSLDLTFTAVADPSEVEIIIDGTTYATIVPTSGDIITITGLTEGSRIDLVEVSGDTSTRVKSITTTSSHGSGSVSVSSTSEPATPTSTSATFVDNFNDGIDSSWSNTDVATTTTSPAYDDQSLQLNDHGMYQDFSGNVKSIRGRMYSTSGGTSRIALGTTSDSRVAALSITDGSVEYRADNTQTAGTVTKGEWYGFALTGLNDGDSVFNFKITQGGSTIFEVTDVPTDDRDAGKRVRFVTDSFDDNGYFDDIEVTYED